MAISVFLYHHHHLLFLLVKKSLVAFCLGKGALGGWKHSWSTVAQLASQAV